MADRAIVDRSLAAAPKDYVVNAGVTLALKAVSATLNGAAATGPFLPAVQLVAPDGTVMWSAVPPNPIAAGGTAIGSWFPGGGVEETAQGSGGISSLTSVAGTVSITSPSGPTADLELPATGVTPGSYGDASDAVTVTVDAEGRITALSQAPIVGGGAVVGSDGWVNDTAEVWTYASGSGGGVATFTVAGDVRAKYTVGTRIKLVQTTTKYFVVSADPTFAGGNTTVTIMAGTSFTLANAAISGNFHSYVLNPQGYPEWFSYTPTTTGMTAVTAAIITFAVHGRICFIYFDLQGTGSATSTTMTVPIATQNTDGATIIAPFQTKDNGVVQTAPGIVAIPAAGSNVFTMNKDYAGNNWTPSGARRIIGECFYQI